MPERPFFGGGGITSPGGATTFGLRNADIEEDLNNDVVTALEELGPGTGAWEGEDEPGSDEPAAEEDEQDDDIEDEDENSDGF